jgi:hypothetical protein
MVIEDEVNEKEEEKKENEKVIYKSEKTILFSKAYSDYLKSKD